MKLVAVAIIIAVVVAAILLRRMNRAIDGRRQADLEARHTRLVELAASRGWSYQQYGAGVVPFAPDRVTVAKAAGENANDVLEGMCASWPFLACQYSYRVGTGESTSVHYRVALALQIAPAVPRLVVRPRIDEFFSQLLGSPITTGDGAFDRTFVVDADSPELAVDVLSSSIRALMLQSPSDMWSFGGSTFVVSEQGGDVAEKIDDLMARADAMLNEIPTPVWERLHADG